MSNTDDTNNENRPVSRTRVRFGIILWVISYLPFPILIAGMLQNNGKLTDAKQYSEFLAVAWGIQILIGFVGLFIAGKESIELVREQGIKKLPKNLWLVIIGRQINKNK